ncbi:hypothetical protein PVAG01_07749 [Phlyctema vagabunda]|uniref:RNase H type-1 domain-containing protein n=1 Tax=Phlyctema vagabunda TaxID=108571 RepID=A0ABR4PDF5_9HELO
MAPGEDWPTSPLLEVADYLYGTGRSTIEHPSEITKYDKRRQVTVMKYSEETPVDTIAEIPMVIAIDRVSGTTVHGNTKITYSMYFGPGSKYNKSEEYNPVTPWGVTLETPNAAELYAVVQVLNFVCETEVADFGEMDLAIMTRSSYIAKGLSQHIMKWKKNGWRDNKGRPIVNAAAFRWIDGKINQMRLRFGFDVNIWLVTKAQNSEADALARESLPCSSGCAICLAQQVGKSVSQGVASFTSINATNSDNAPLPSSTPATDQVDSRPNRMLSRQTQLLAGYGTLRSGLKLLDLSIPSFEYWVFRARRSSLCKDLFSRLGIPFPPARPEVAALKSVIAVIRRLVVVGEDRIDNFSIIFGPLWREVGESQPTLNIRMLWLECRLQVLLCPLPQTLTHARAEQYDVAAPRWTPRAPSVAEEHMIRTIKLRKKPSSACMRAMAKEYDLPSLKDFIEADEQAPSKEQALA